MNILEVAKKLDLEITDSVSEVFYRIDLSKNFDLDEINSEIDSINDDGRVSEYADSNTPIYYNEIDKKYAEQTAYNEGYSIDDAISEGLCEAMSCEADISKAKQVALYVAIEREAISDIEEFKKELNEKYESVFDDNEDEE